MNTRKVIHRYVLVNQGIALKSLFDLNAFVQHSLGITAKAHKNLNRLLIDSNIFFVKKNDTRFDCIIALL